MTMSVGTIVRAALWVGVIAAASPVYAQATRTWVSGVGDDVNPCSRTAPCKTFAGAIAKTVDGGEIDTLDPGGFGTVTITKSITIANGGSGVGSILASSTNAINVVAPGATVYLRGLTLQGAGGFGSPGISGVHVIAGDVHIDDCVIQNFTGVQGDINNPGAGVWVTASSPSRVFITNSRLYGNRYGVLNNSTAASPVALVDAVLDRNTDFGLDGIGANATFSLRHTTVTGSTSGIDAPAPAKVFSYGDNLISGVVSGTVLTPAALR